MSCERVFQPQFQNKPVVVLSNNDGCVISRSEEAKALGIPMGAPEFQYKDLIKQHKVKVFSSNYALYGDLSNRVMKTLQQFTPDIENYSIDEAFLNFEKVKIDDYNDYGIAIKKRIQKWVGIPVCVGFGETKALSKIANRIAKKFKERTAGIYVIDTHEKRTKALKWTKIEDVWGIGYRLTKKLKAKNIHTAYDFVQPYNTSYIKECMGVVGLRLQMELQGISVLELEEQPLAKKNIAVTRTFEKSVSTFEEMKERVSTFATVASEKLRKQKSCCYGIVLYIRKNQYQTSSNRYSYTAFTHLPFATQSALTLSQTAIKMLKKMFEEGEIYNKAGIILSEIIPQEEKQFNLFEEENPKHEKLMQVMDNIHKKTGERKIRLGNQDLNRTWKMKQNHLSKRYTTNSKELLEIKCH